MLFPLRPRYGACMEPKDTVGRIYKYDHYTLMHTKLESYGPCGFGEDVLMFFPLKAFGASYFL